MQGPEVRDSVPCLKGGSKRAGTASAFAPHRGSVHSELLSSLEYMGMHVITFIYLH